MAVKKNPLVKQAKLTYEYLTGDEAVQILEYLRERAMRDEIAARQQGRKVRKSRRCKKEYAKNGEWNVKGQSKENYNNEIYWTYRGRIK